MTDLFRMCADRTLRYEGGKVDNVNDSGGATNFGISLRFLKRLTNIDKGYQEGDIDKDGDIDERDVDSLTIGKVKQLLYKHFWLPFGEDIETWHPRLAFKVFDFAVNASPAVAIKTLQKAVGAMPDGVIGAETRIKLSQSHPDEVISEFSLNQCAYYAQITTIHPNYLEFLVGWIKRASDLGEGLT